MPELPEVHTTVKGLKKKVVGFKISAVWTSYKSNYAPYKNQIKNPRFFSKFKRLVVGQKIIRAERRHKNILIHLSNNQTILIHLKMTGHLLYGNYKQTGLGHGKWIKEEWEPTDKNKHLHDPFNKHLRLVFTFSNKKNLVLSDVRKFAKVTVLDTDKVADELQDLGPEPLERSFTFRIFKQNVLRKPRVPIKSILMDHSVVAGIGNIYSDEILFASGVHPESRPEKIPEKKLRAVFKNIKPLLRKGIKFGGDSTSDYRDITGAPGKFQRKHNVYKKKGKPCPKKDGGVIKRKVIRGRSAHFCPKHQRKY